MRDAHPAPEAATDNDDGTADIQQPRLWRANGWTATVVKNEDDEGWAVAMTHAGEAEPALVGPWTMGRDKKNPKPLDGPAFSTLVKTAAEVLRRHEQQRHAELNRSVTVTADTDGARITVTMTIEPDDENPTARLVATDTSGEILADTGVAASFRLDARSAAGWIAQGYGRPR